MNSQRCIYCNNTVPDRSNRFCIYCGAPLQSGTQAGRFFLALVKCLGFWIAMELVTGAVLAVYQLIVQASVPVTATISESVYNAYYWDSFSRYSAIVMAGADILLIAVFALFYRIIKKRLSEKISVRTMPVSSFTTLLVLGISAQFAITAALTLFYTLFPAALQSSPDLENTYSRLFGNGSFIAEVVYIGLVTPLTEEIVFRGLIFKTMRGAMPKYAAILLSATVFGVSHGNIEQFIYTFALGIILAAVLEKYNSIWACFAIHCAFNLSSYLVSAMPLSNGTQLMTMLLLGTGAFLLCLAFVLFTKPIYKSEIPLHERII